MGERKSGRRRVLAELNQALVDGALVTLRRNIPKAGSVTGVVVGVGAQWLALAVLANELDWDGWAMIPLRTVRGCRRIEAEPWGRFVSAVQAHRGTAIPQPPRLPLDDSAELMRSVAASFPLVTVARDYALPGASWIGVVGGIDLETVNLWTVDPRANWGDAPWLIDIADITRIDVGGDYEDALWLACRDRIPTGVDAPKGS